MIGKEMCEIILFCNHPVTGELMDLLLKVHKDELLPSVLDKAYELMEFAPHIPIKRCRLVKYNFWNEVMEQSFDEFQHQTIGLIVGRAGNYSLFLETRKENETFKKYNDGGVNLKVSVVDLSTGEVGPAVPMRGELGWTVEELKQHIGDLFNIKSSCMRIVKEEPEDYWSDSSVRDISDVGGTLRGIPISIYNQAIFHLIQ
ncbi:PREDICTED: ubiquitin carboxyl-terminal hydrolase 47-like [Amphimedon queenslandica]|uniref:Uncharacterized protein n=1 Tax=Amphimedon queenslandica TaxID=400682 RepID=A0AAN0JNX0_AMPQE|nr:PREDICTED: ubiquitin carboxyl-terminal hydrolase 47-like [Amphimedon queenslandica]|eukprot:XP_019858735.1 PREDICTED: ubiquitin carboxyl-terminal hydrolase 47-like [Amphimedon queenslandica]